MIVNLIRKDFILAKKAVVRALVICLVIIPVLIVGDGGGDLRNNRAGIFIFLYFLILMILAWMMQVNVEEEKNPHAAALLCAAPCSRRDFVVAKYICYLILFAGCAILYSIIPALYQGLNFLNAKELLLTFFVGTILYGVFTVVAIRDGIAKARYAITVAILIMSLGPPVVTGVFHLDLTTVVQFMSNGSNAALPVILGCAGVCVFLLFMIASIRNFEKKEL